MQVDLEQHDAVKRQLRAKGVTFADISVEIGCRPSLVTMVSQGRRRSREIENAIARRIGVSPEMLWPSRYKEEEEHR